MADFDLNAIDADIASAKARRASIPKDAPSKAESFVRGAAQGATMGFADEIAAAARAVGMSPEALAAAVMSGPFGAIGAGTAQAVGAGASLVKKGLGGVVDDYRAARTDERSKFSAAEEENPKTSFAGNVLGGVASSVAIPVGAPATLGKAALTGAGYGAAAATGMSEADLTRGDVGGAAKDAAIGGAIGAGAGAIGYGASKGASKVKNWLFPKKDLVAKVAADLPGLAEPSSSTTVDDFANQAAGLESEVQSVTGKKLGLSPGQTTGSKEVLARERTMRQTPGIMDTAQRSQRERLSVAGEYAEKLVKSIAADPEKLSNGEIGDGLANAINGEIKSRISARSAATRDLYAKADKLLADKKIAPIDEVSAFLEKEVANAIGPFEPSAAPLKKTLEALQSVSDGKGLASVSAVRRLAQQWGAQSEGTGNLLGDLPIAQRRRIASTLADMLNRSVDSAAESGAQSDAGVVALREANRLYREHSQGIDDIATSAVKRILNKTEVGAPDEIPKLVMSMSPKQIGGLVGVLEKTDRVAAQQLKAGALLEAFRSGGAAAREGQFGKEATTYLTPGKIIDAINGGDRAAKFRALLGDDKAAATKLGFAVDIMKRLQLGPSIEGSDTYAKTAQFLAPLMKASQGNQTLTGTLVELTKKLANSGVFSDEKAAEWLVAPGGADVLLGHARAQLAVQQKADARSIRAAVVAASKLADLARSVGGGVADSRAPQSEIAEARP